MISARPSAEKRSVRDSRIMAGAFLARSLIMGRPDKVRLGDVLVAQKAVSQDQLGIALEQQKKSGRKFGRVLVELGFVSDEQICEAISKQLNIPYVNLKFYNLNPDVVRRLTEAQARRFRALVLESR